MSAAPGDILERIWDMRPPGVKLAWGGVHRDRLALGGYGVEARVALKAALAPRPDNARFLIVGRARSGTTLITRLLNGHSRIVCDGEVLKRNVLAPVAHLDALARKSGAAVYGAKLLSYQMVLVHRIRDPRAFRAKLEARGVRPVHLVRDTFAQTLSLAVAQGSGRYHSDRGPAARDHATIRPDPQEFVARLAWNDALLRYERAFFEGADAPTIDYERDLATPEAQAATLARLCTAFGVAPEHVDAPLRKMLPTDPRRVLENHEEVFAAMEAAGMGRLVPGPA